MFLMKRKTKEPKRRVKELDRKPIIEEINNVLESFLFDKKEKKPDLERILENSKEKIRKFKSAVPPESDYIFMEEKDEKEERINLRYSVRREEKDEKGEDRLTSYGVSIIYQSTESEEKVEAEINFEDNKGNKGCYSVSIRQDKDTQKYNVDVLYRENNREVNIRYAIPIESYLEQLQEQKQDFTKLADKSLHIFPESIMGSVLGFTYIGENFMGRRADLTGKTAFMVDVHESIHTPDEYETRILTDWMLSRPMQKYKR